MNSQGSLPVDSEKDCCVGRLNVQRGDSSLQLLSVCDRFREHRRCGRSEGEQSGWGPFSGQTTPEDLGEVAALRKPQGDHCVLLVVLNEERTELRRNPEILRTTPSALSQCNQSLTICCNKASWTTEA